MKKNSTNEKTETTERKPELTEKRVREIAREEIIKWHRETSVPLFEEDPKEPFLKSRPEST